LGVAGLGWYVEPSFSIGLDKKDLQLLESVKLSLGGIGSIMRHSELCYVWRVSSLKDLTNTIIPYFDEFTLHTQKRADFELFKRVVELINQKKHLTLDGVQEIVNIKAVHNKGLSDSLKLAFPKTSPVSRPIFTLSSIPDSQWLAGFTTGEGCFYIDIFKSKSTKTGFQVRPRFILTQHSRDENLIGSLIELLDCGSVRVSEKAVYLIVSSFSDIENKVVPFFTKYNIHGAKDQDFKDWVHVVEMLNKKEHLALEGLDKIRIIQSKMKRGRSL